MKFYDYGSVRRQETQGRRESRNRPLHAEQVSRKGKHYCEACRSIQPDNGYPVVKGWKCTGCRTADRNKRL